MAVAEDFREKRISNRLIASGLIWGLAFRTMGEGCAGIVHFLVNISIPVILLFLLFQMHVLGAGDIKLFSVAGSFLTVKQILYVIPLAFLTAAAIGLCKVAYLKKTAAYPPDGRTCIHFSVFILISYMIVWGCAVG